MDYTQICKYAGKLFLESQVEIERLSLKNLELIEENERLKAEIRNLQDNIGNNPVKD